jgi:hypothetical protein
MARIEDDLVRQCKRFSRHRSFSLSYLHLKKHSKNAFIGMPIMVTDCQLPCPYCEMKILYFVVFLSFRILKVVVRLTVKIPARWLP